MPSGVRPRLPIRRAIAASASREAVGRSRVGMGGGPGQLIDQRDRFQVLLHLGVVLHLPWFDMAHRRWLTGFLLGVAGVVGVACGSEAVSGAVDTTVVATETTVSVPEAPVAEIPVEVVGPWSESILGAPISNSPLSTAVGDAGVVAVSSASDELVAWFDDGTGLVQAEVDDAGLMPESEFVSVGGVTALDVGFAAVGHSFPAFDPLMWRSDDGSTWKLSDHVGLDGPVEFRTVASTGSTTVIGGAVLDGSDPISGRFSPAVWTTEDLRSWTRVDLEMQAEARVMSLISTPSGLLAFVSSDNAGGSIWRSDDGGLTWERDQANSDALGLRRWVVFDTAVHRDVVVAVGWSMEGERPLLASSSDGGSTWVSTNTADFRADGIRVIRTVAVVDGRFWASTFRAFDSSVDVDRCYQDLSLCDDNRAEVVVLESSDGSSWGELDLHGLESDGPYEFDAIVAAGEHVSLIGADDGDLVSWTWSEGTELGLREPAPKRPAVEIPLVEWGTDLAVGELRRYPLYIHCGIDVLGNFNGTYWSLHEVPSGAAREADWPVAQQTIFGHVMLTDSDTIEYQMPDGQVIGIYRPSNAEPVGCD